MKVCGVNTLFTTIFPKVKYLHDWRTTRGPPALICAFAEVFNAAHDSLDLLINNAGVMMPPFGTTAEGFELQIGVNYIGHFALSVFRLGCAQLSKRGLTTGLKMEPMLYVSPTEAK